MCGGHFGRPATAGSSFTHLPPRGRGYKPKEEKMDWLTKEWVERTSSAHNGISLGPIRYQQDPKVVAEICQLSTRIAGGRAQIGDCRQVIGCADFMRGQEGWHLLELNGGSSRGFQILDLQQWGQLLANVVQRAGRPGRALVGHLDQDSLLVEKLAFSMALKNAGWEVTTLPYSQLTSPELLQEFDFVIGDGVTRRLGLNQSLAGVNALVANMIAHTTDSKLATYRHLAEVNLRRTGTVPLQFLEAEDYQELVAQAGVLLNQVKAVTPKFANGSGGAGVLPIFCGEPVEERLQAALDQYRMKMGPEKKPWPAAVMELVHPPHLGRFENLGERAFDTRFYYSVSPNGVVSPHGGLFRVARSLFVDGGREAYVTNLSGYGGIEIERGLGYNRQTLAAAQLSTQDMAQAAAAGAIIFASLAST